MNSLFVATTLSVLFVVLISASAEARSGEDLEDELMESQGDYSDYSMEPRKRSGWNSWGWGPAGKRSAPTVMSQSRNELCRLLKSLAAIPETAAVRQEFRILAAQCGRKSSTLRDLSVSAWMP